MKNIHFKNKQLGYLLEIPIMMMAVAMLLAMVLPVLPKIIGKIAFTIGVLVWIGGIYYMVVIPGWQPENDSRLRYPWNLIVFIIIAALLAFVMMVYLRTA